MRFGKLKLALCLACFSAFYLLSCSDEEVRVYEPIDKLHIGEQFIYDCTINNIKESDLVVLNFYKEEVTDLDYVEYDETDCNFIFRKGETSKYKISWDFKASGSYVEVQYGQNGIWHKMNNYDWNEYILTANDGMTVRMVCQPSKKQIDLTVSDFSIEEYEE